jgi:hypothetical protein
MAERGRVLAFGRAPFRRGGTSEPIESELNRLSCADLALANEGRKRQPFLAFARQYCEMPIAARGARQQFALSRL